MQYDSSKRRKYVKVRERFSVLCRILTLGLSVVLVEDVFFRQDRGKTDDASSFVPYIYENSLFLLIGPYYKYRYLHCCQDLIGTVPHPSVPLLRVITCTLHIRFSSLRVLSEHTNKQSKQSNEASCLEDAIAALVALADAVVPISQCTGPFGST